MATASSPIMLDSTGQSIATSLSSIASSMGGGGSSPTTASVFIAVSDWSGTSCAKTVSGVTTGSTIFVSPAATSFQGYCDSQVRASAQGTNSITFTCVDVPSDSLTVNVAVFN